MQTRRLQTALQQSAPGYTSATGPQNTALYQYDLLDVISNTYRIYNIFQQCCSLSIAIASELMYSTRQYVQTSCLVHTVLYC